MTDPQPIGFRPMTPADLPLVEAWLARPHLRPWWPAEDIVEITRAVHGDDPVEPWILGVDGRDAGYFQVYDVGSDPDYAAACAGVGAGPGTAGMDYLVGEPELIGRGLGTRAIARFVAEITFGRAPWPAVCAGPDPANGASIRVLEKNGFRYVGAIDTRWGPEHLMVLTRADWSASASVERAAQDRE
ncbi:MAG: GNAT family N-acetyltransferase [Acidimicrobiia bacterium]|jgi:aminoglycoside 6'-N-acetyltransferase